MFFCDVNFARFLKISYFREDIQATASGNKKGVKSSSVIGTRGTNKGVQGKTASGCFWTVCDHLEREASKSVLKKFENERAMKITFTMSLQNFLKDLI